MSEAKEKTIRRTEERLQIETRGAGFLGSRLGTGKIFDYILKDLTPTGIGFLVPGEHPSNSDWITDGIQLRFHLPFLLGGRYFSSGTVRWHKSDAAETGTFCGVSLDSPVPLYYPVFVSLDAGVVSFSGGRDASLMHHIVKDAWLLKRGIAVYFKHLVPYFRRLGRSDNSDQAAFMDVFTAKLERNIGILDRLRRLVRDQGVGSPGWSLSTFKQAILPEAAVQDFPLQFGSKSVLPYLESIRRLDLRLYLNYNAMVLMLLAEGESVAVAPVIDRRAAQR